MMTNKDTMNPVSEYDEFLVKKNRNNHNKRKLTTNTLRNNSSKIFNYESQESIEMDNRNKKITKHQNNPLPSVKDYKCQATNEIHVHTNYSHDNHSLSKQSSLECDMSETEDHIKNVMNNLNNNKPEFKQQSKTAISLLNEWAMRGCEEKKPIVVSYVLVAITGFAHGPVFTYMCQIHNKKTFGKGKSKKEAKQNAAAQMCEKLFSILNDSDKVITSTTATDNFEVTENDTTVLSSTEGSQIIDGTISELCDEGLEQLKYKSVQTAHCDMNPVGALQELCTNYKWTPPFYNLEILTKDPSGRKTLIYKFTCSVFHLQTTGTGSFKKGAKRMAARLMLENIFDIGTEKLNELKSSDQITLLSNESCEKSKSIAVLDQNQEESQNWFSAYHFRSYFTEKIAAKAATTIVPLIENKDNPIPIDQQVEQYKTELEQYIIHYDPNVSAVNKLSTVCEQLSFEAIYVCLGVQKDIINNISQDGDYAVLVQVTTVPITVTVGYAATSEMAAEKAAKSILDAFHAMLLYTKSPTISLNNNDENTIKYAL